MAPTKQEILGASAGWVAVTLNVLPGLGAGPLSTRWKSYWITSALATTWFVLGAVRARPEAAVELKPIIGLCGLALSSGTASKLVWQ